LLGRERKSISQKKEEGTRRGRSCKEEAGREPVRKPKHPHQERGGLVAQRLRKRKERGALGGEEKFSCHWGSVGLLMSFKWASGPTVGFPQGGKKIEGRNNCRIDIYDG